MHAPTSANTRARVNTQGKQAWAGQTHVCRCNVSGAPIRAAREDQMKLLHIPARSPEFNSIESFWGWLRQAMRRRDLEDMRNKRPALGKTAWMCRLKRLLKTKKAQTVAKKKFQNFKKVCRVVYRKNGAHSGL